MIMLNHIYKMMGLYWCNFDNDVYVGSILFEFFDYELFASIGDNKTWRFKIGVNPVQM